VTGLARATPDELWIGLVSISDRASGGQYADEGLPALRTWLASAFELSAIPERHQHTLSEILTRLAPQHCFAALSHDGQVVSMGLGVLQSGCIGLYDIVTRPEHRGRGYARQLIADILAWAASQGAHTAYLQVMLNNAPALRLYGKMGFREQYQYWYRVKG
jgi:GNAT superfamily N-acetyltransferase